MDVFANTGVADLKRRSIRGGIIAVSSQGLRLAIQVVSIMVLSRLLGPSDFGIQSMIVTLTGFLALFRDCGLSMATVQREVITHEQTSTLFWINVAVGSVLALFALAAAPMLVFFYKDPRLLWAAPISGLAFVFNGIAAQHQALLVRALRYATMAKIEVLTIGCSTALGIVMAALGFGYWSLIGMAVSGPAVSAVAFWLAVPWRPGLPVRACGVRSMLNFGGTVTGDTLLTYFGYNSEKFLLGRFFGPTVLGLYTRAFQLVNLPLNQLSASIFNIVFPALSRIQNDPERVCRYFLKSYSVILGVCVPITISSALFAEEIISVFLGPKWMASIPILRLLAPTVVAFALINPFGWYLMATGRALRSLKTSFLATPTVIVGISLGLPYGPTGVATGYSIATVLLIVPIIAWSKSGTAMRTSAILEAVKGPIVSGVAASLAGIAFTFFADSLPLLPRLAAGLFLVLGTYFLVLLFGMGQWRFYRDVFRQIAGR